MIKDGVFQAKKVQSFKVVIDGTEYPMTYPKVKHQRELTRKIASMEANSPEQVDVMIEWLESLGLPSEATDEMAAEDLAALVEALVGAKKN